MQKGNGKPLPSLLVAEPEIIRYLNKGPVAGLTDPENYLDLAGEMVDRVLSVTASIPLLDSTKQLGRQGGDARHRHQAAMADQSLLRVHQIYRG